jgi:hypothetical protein
MIFMYWMQSLILGNAWALTGFQPCVRFIPCTTGSGRAVPRAVNPILNLLLGSRSRMSPFTYSVVKFQQDFMRGALIGNLEWEDQTRVTGWLVSHVPILEIFGDYTLWKKSCTPIHKGSFNGWFPTSTIGANLHPTTGRRDLGPALGEGGGQVLRASQLISLEWVTVPPHHEHKPGESLPTFKRNLVFQLSTPLFGRIYLN